MLITYVYNQCQAMEEKLEEMGMTSVDVEFVVNFTAYTAGRVKVRFNCVEELTLEAFNAKTVSDEDLKAAIAAAWAYINSLKSAETQAKRKVLHDVSDIVTRARELDMGEDFIAPIAGAFETLSSNLLADQSNDG